MPILMNRSPIEGSMLADLSDDCIDLIPLWPLGLVSPRRSLIVPIDDSSSSCKITNAVTTSESGDAECRVLNCFHALIVPAPETFIRLALCQSVYSGLPRSEPKLALPDPRTLLRESGGKFMCAANVFNNRCPAECRVV